METTTSVVPVVADVLGDLQRVLHWHGTAGGANAVVIRTIEAATVKLVGLAEGLREAREANDED